MALRADSVQTSSPMADRKELDPARKRLLELIGSNPEVNLKSLSLDLGRSKTYLQDFIDGSPRNLRHEDRITLARKLGCSPDELKVASRSAKRPERDIAESPNGRVTFKAEDRGVGTWPRDLKIIGHVKAGVDGFFLDQGEFHGMAHRPPALRDVPNAFAVYVHDDSMSPAFEPGMVLWVHPTKPVKPGDNVIIELDDGQAFVKRLVRRTASEVICRQHEPKKDLKYPAKKVARLLYVVGSYKED